MTYIISLFILLWNCLVNPNMLINCWTYFLRMVKPLMNLSSFEIQKTLESVSSGYSVLLENYEYLMCFMMIYVVSQVVIMIKEIVFAFCIVLNFSRKGFCIVLLILEYFVLMCLWLWNKLSRDPKPIPQGVIQRTSEDIVR